MVTAKPISHAANKPTCMRVLRFSTRLRMFSKTTHPFPIKINAQITPMGTSAEELSVLSVLNEGLLVVSNSCVVVSGDVVLVMESVAVSMVF